MTLIMGISVGVGIWLSFKMREEIQTGFYRVADYAVTLPLLIVTVTLLNIASRAVSQLDGVLYYAGWLLQVPLAFGILVLTWALTLLICVLLFRLFGALAQ